MRLSVVVPFYNSEKTLHQCLGSIFKSDYEDFEIIAADDHSTDASVSIAKKFPCKLVKVDKKGESLARNKGAEAAKGDIIVFIDSDVVIKEDSLTRICNDFKDNNDIAAVTGLLSKEHPHKNFFSQYKNLYMNYIFNKNPEYVNFLYGSIFAIKREVMEEFETQTLFCGVDTELGVRISEKGAKILLDKKLEVVHLKKHSLLSFVANDFRIPFSWTYTFMKHGGVKYLFKKKKFAHAKLNQITGVLLSPLSLLALLLFAVSVLNIWPFLVLVSMILLLNKGFLNFLRKEKGSLFFLKSLVANYFDCIVMFSAITCGFIKYPFRNE